MGNVIPTLPALVLLIALFTIAMFITVKYFSSHQVLVMFIVSVLLILGGLLIFMIPSTNKTTVSGTAGPQLSLVTSVNPDPFTYTPGSTDSGNVAFSKSASSYVDELSCLVKSINTQWSNISKKCTCKTGWFGHTCDNSGYDSEYVSLTTTSKISLTTDVSFTTDSLTLWPSTDATSGCTNQCSILGNSCLGVLYSQGICTPITSLTFSEAPIHDTSVIANSNTIYLKRNSLQQIKMTGYYNVIFGSLPPRYFIGNIISGLTGQNYYTDNGGSRILYFSANTDNTFVGIPDYIIVNSLGTLYISTTVIPLPIIPSSLIVTFTTPITITRNTFLANFGRSTSTTTFYVRYIPL